MRSQDLTILEIGGRRDSEFNNRLDELQAAGKGGVFGGKFPNRNARAAEQQSRGSIWLFGLTR